MHMAPEVFLCEQDYSEKADIFSAAVCMVHTHPPTHTHIYTNTHTHTHTHTHTNPHTVSLSNPERDKERFLY